MIVKSKTIYKDVAPISPSILGTRSLDCNLPAAPVKGILRRGSSSEGGKPPWNLTGGSSADPRPLTDSISVRAQPLQDTRSTPDPRIVAEVKPMEVKQEKDIPVDTPPFVKKVSSVAKAVMTL